MLYIKVEYYTGIYVEGLEDIYNVAGRTACPGNGISMWDVSGMEECLLHHSISFCDVLGELLVL